MSQDILKLVRMKKTMILFYLQSLHLNLLTRPVQPGRNNHIRNLPGIQRPAKRTERAR